jgi:hypothetical protein
MLKDAPRPGSGVPQLLQFIVTWKGPKDKTLSEGLMCITVLSARSTGRVLEIGEILGIELWCFP